jgi:glycosyltransferase involved in cell wall biosynthesis|tara:strand:+ start:4513 stop:5196 length:684 start_codon:yes stop_codon:yes gene_type:complete
MIKISIIIPLAPNESEWPFLLQSLNNIQHNIEILLVTSETNLALSSMLTPFNAAIKIIHSEQGRAKMLNTGSKMAKGRHLWFLHADSQIKPNTIHLLEKAIFKHPNSLIYFDLMFLKDSSRMMYLNSLGVRFRSHVLKTPFGDQGLCIKKSNFIQLGGYPDNLAYGEDHVFVWKSRQNNIEIKPANATIFTSGRKYKENGWLKTTLTHQYLWVKQAWPEWRKLMEMR